MAYVTPVVGSLDRDRDRRCISGPLRARLQRDGGSGRRPPARLRSTRFPLEEITRAEAHPHAMMGSLRTFGIGGFFGFIGRFRNSILGSYRAYATDGARAVVLERSSGDPVVVTPDRPAEFAHEVRSRAGLSSD